MIFTRKLLTAVVTATLLLTAGPSFASAATVSPGDTAWVLISSALVMLMTPGLGLFYGGMVRKKNVLATIFQSFIIVGLVGVQWVLVGYSLAFGPDKWHVIGSLEWIGLRSVGQLPNPDYSPTIPHMAFMIFQAMFAIITPALITGAFAERLSFKAFLVFMALWCTLVYDPVAHVVWAPGGFLRELGALDFAGGTVVHVCSGAAALAAVLAIGPRKGFGKDDMKPHNLTMTLTGASLLWFGWFGFNAGSALVANGLAASAFVVTNTAAASAALSWLFVEWLHRGKPTVLGAASGAVAGLVGITPAAGFVGPVSSVIIGLVAGTLCYFAIVMKGKLGYDDSLDVVGIHGVGGVWGALATGLFASPAVNEAGNPGLFYGNPGQLAVQAAAVAIVFVYSFVVTLLLLKLVSLFCPLRVAEEEEENGLDITQHGEVGYVL
jgi:Amt family ammonium transporter